MFSFHSPISIALALALACSGCSFCFVTPPPIPHKQPVARPEANCSTSVAAPVIDGLITGYQVFRTGYALQASDRDYNAVPISREADMAIGIGMSALFLASTIYGGVNVAACKRLKHGPPSEQGDGADGDRTNGWRINKEAPEPWHSPRPAAPAPAPQQPAAPAKSQVGGHGEPTPAVSEPAPATPAPTTPAATTPAPTTPREATPPPATPAAPAPVPPAPAKAEFPGPP